jgi:hypothetical protein
MQAYWLNSKNLSGSAYLKSAVGLLNQDEDEDYVDAARLKGRIDHSTAGAQLIWFELSKQGKRSADPPIKEPIGGATSRFSTGGRDDQRRGTGSTLAKTC